MRNLGDENSMRDFLHSFMNDPSRVLYAKGHGLMTVYLRKPGTTWTGGGAQYYYANFGDKSWRDLNPGHFNKLTQDLADLIVKDWGVKPFEIMNYNEVLLWPSQTDDHS